MAREKRLVFKFSTASPPRELEPRVFEGLASTPDIDRVKDRILGWDVAGYLAAGGPILFNHDPDQLIGRALDVTPTTAGLRVRFRLLPAGTSEAVDLAYAALQAGALKGFSIGFLPRDKPRANDAGGFDFGRVEVIEISLTPIPANAAALAASLGRKRRARLHLAGRRRARPASRKAPAKVVPPKRKVVPRAFRPLIQGLIRRQVRASVSEAVRKARGRLCDHSGPCSCDS